ncbi:hypothetical protein KAFR_0C02570 [Kazachstania africana CBS 2517]|uniref:Tyrosine-protein phosphatase domain-containing protein n=1 Tax=Kazachstania africana (strain ATCC 22294 / BCRC 22015 / CBS 2517 / CECT 1963 / NBRC 1671 / NRRL Y-8276) TaxID=1071382 RepID=H2ASA0_KAZAF|nr:hypothetical protein KAFR_0C02570 [Kazachstania africana CBS 2517]CCF57250.1 hypothetical protein KAFR_0C02570 [Kazachstania africana CBS 2517]
MSLVTPLQFNTVQPNLYRGSYPREINLSFFKTLRLKNILSLTPEPLDDTISQFCKDNNIQMKHVECNTKAPGDKSKKVKRKKKQVPIEYDVVIECIKFIVDKRNYPIYIHCSNGELISSLVIACVRKFSFWSTVSILNEFLIYNSSINVYERNFIENFNAEIEIDGLKINDKVPWITGRFVTTNEKREQRYSTKKEAESAKEPTATKVSSNIPSSLPKLKFHSF